jgi:toxin ParE1/3/4
MNGAWTVRPGRQAEQDYIEILRWTKRSFGEVQAKTYSESISLAIQALKEGPDILGSKLRDEIEPGNRTLHVARPVRKGRHLVVCRVGGEQTIDVLRLLHDSMDLPRHLSAGNDL